MADSKLDVVLRLQGARKFQGDASKSAGSIDKIGNAGKRAEKNLDRAGKRSDKLGRNMKRLGTAAKVGGVALGGMALIAGKNAVKSTQDLTKMVIGLQRATKMDTQEAVRWATQAKVRGIDAKALNMAMGTLSKNLTLAGEGGKSQQEAFDRLGISQKQVKATGGDLSKLLPVMSDRFKKMGPSAGRTASMMALMGRGWQTITPLMSEGSGAMNEQLKLADKYGVKLGDKPIKSQKDLLAVQREMKIAQLGWQVQFSTNIAPKLVKAFAWINRTSQSLKGIFNWADKHPTITKMAGALVLTSVALAKMGRMSQGIATVGRGLGRLGKTNAGQAIQKRLGDAAKGLWNRMRPGVSTAGKNMNTTMGRAGNTAGRTAGDNIGTGVERQAKTGGSKMRRAFGAAGLAVGILMASFIAKKIGDEWVKSDSAIKRAAGAQMGGEVRGRDRDTQTRERGGTPSPFDITKYIPGFRQHGGRIGVGRSAFVGEGGKPEIVTGRPGGAFVTPLRKMATAEQRKISVSGETVLHNNVYLDGKRVAESVSRHASDAKARR